MKRNIIERLTSRKFIVTAITAIAGIITAIIGDNELVQIIAGAAMTIIPTVVYCITEGKIDAESVKTIVDATVDVAEKLSGDDTTTDSDEPTTDGDKNTPGVLGNLSDVKENVTQANK